MRRNNNKIKVLHSALISQPASGTLRQMYYEYVASHDSRLSWDVKVFSPICHEEYADIMVPQGSNQVPNSKTPLGLFCSRIKLKIYYYRWLLKESEKYDLLLSRYSMGDPFLLWFLVKCKRPVYLVHHTLEVPELSGFNGLIAFIKTHLERFIGKYNIRKAAGLVAVTQEILDYELERADMPNKPAHVYPNGCVYSENKYVDERRTTDPELLFLAGNFSKWHGLDLLLNEIKGVPDIFVLHLVGNINQEDLLRAKKDKRIVVHGILSHDEITLLANRCWLGLSSFALHRQMMKETCTLKVRDYLMMGLPVYAGNRDVFPKEFLFYKHGKLSIKNILDYARTLRTYSKEEVSFSARYYLEKSVLLCKLYGDLRSHN